MAALFHFPLDGGRWREVEEALGAEFESGNHQIYWDDVAMFCHFEDYKLGIHEMQSEDIIEIDGLDELVAIDHSYQSYLHNAGNKPETAKNNGGINQ